jgi:hypothetical protein
LFPERAIIESFWSEALSLYTEDSKTDNGGGGSVANYAWDFNKSQPI